MARKYLSHAISSFSNHPSGSVRRVFPQRNISSNNNDVTDSELNSMPSMRSKSMQYAINVTWLNSQQPFEVFLYMCSAIQCRECS